MILKAPESGLLEMMAGIVGAQNSIRDGADMTRYLTEERGLYTGKAAAVLRPGSTAEVAEILKTANQHRIAIVPQGGGTGLVGGQVPWDNGDEIVLSLERLNAVREVNASGNAMTLEAGVPLARAQEIADDADRLFPLSLGSEGTCQIGGNLSTNAGGTAVLAYGNARDLVLGLEVVLADGRIWNGLKSLRKDNTGYDLKNLFVGSEGTLGIITAASLKLFPKPRARATAFVGVPDPAASVALLARSQSSSGGRVTGFELMSRIGLEFVLEHGSAARDPIAEPMPWYVLLELSSGDDGGELQSVLENILGNGLEAGEVIDAAVATSDAQSQSFWHMRQMLSDVQKPEGGSIKHDVSVPVSDVPRFLDEASEAALKVVPGARVVAFGHVGDGNIHFNISQPLGADKAEFLSHWDTVNEAVHEVVARYGGSVSAEHGIGRMKRDLLARIGDPVGLDLMRTLKRTLDPNGILNPGKVLQRDADA